MYDKILVPIDGSGGAENAVSRTFDFARTFGSSIHVLYVVETGSESVEIGHEQRDESDVRRKNEGDRRPLKSRNEQLNVALKRRESFAREFHTELSSNTRTRPMSV